VFYTKTFASKAPFASWGAYANTIMKQLHIDPIWKEIPSSLQPTDTNILRDQHFCLDRASLQTQFWTLSPSGVVWAKQFIAGKGITPRDDDLRRVHCVVLALDTSGTADKGDDSTLGGTATDGDHNLIGTGQICNPNQVIVDVDYLSGRGVNWDVPQHRPSWANDLSCTFRTVCHELGHCLGMVRPPATPDHHDLPSEVDGTPVPTEASGYVTAGHPRKWCIMGSTAWEYFWFPPMRANEWAPTDASGSPVEDHSCKHRETAFQRLAVPLH